MSVAAPVAGGPSSRPPTRLLAAEADLLTLVSVALGVADPAPLRGLLVEPRRAPERLSRSAARIYGELLAKGTVAALAREGGWRGGAPGERLWERRDRPVLAFGPGLFGFLCGLLRAPLADGGRRCVGSGGTLTPAEEVILAGLLERARGLDCARALWLHPTVRSSPLLVLLYAGELGAAAGLESVPRLRPAEHVPLLVGVRSWAVGAWLSAEAAKGAVDAPEVLRRVGEAQGRALDAFFEAVGGRLEHRGAAGFLVEFGARWQDCAGSGGSGLELQPWRLRVDTPLAERVAARRAALAPWRALLRLRAWDEEHRAVRFFEDDAPAARALVEAWAADGPRAFAAAERRIQELEPWPAPNGA